MNEKWLIWINNKLEIVQYDILKTSLIKLSLINGTPLGLTVDWLERSLYLIEFTNRSTIFKINLNFFTEEIDKFKILERESKVVGIEMSPFTKQLYWSEMKQNKTVMMRSRVDGTNIRPFFENTTKKDGNRTCNCSISDMDPHFALDHSVNPFEPTVAVFDRKSQMFVSSDIDGCICEIIAGNILMKPGYRLRKLKADLGMVYWANEKKLNAFNRKQNKIQTAGVCIYTVISLITLFF